MFPGGISDKLGNQYEAKWLIRQLLDVISGKADWIKYEGLLHSFKVLNSLSAIKGHPSCP